jgi:hypothetical protein
MALLLRRDVLRTVGLAILAGPASVRATSRLGSPPGGSLDASSDPWTAAQTISPAAFVKELTASSAGAKPIVVCCGFHMLFEGAHIPGASFHGPSSTPAGLDLLQKFTEPLVRSTNIVIYCGCCPLVHCPNIRPAFAALHDMGFTRVRVLAIPTSFAADWVAQGYPVAKGK